MPLFVDYEITQTWEGIWEQCFEIFVSITCIEHKHLLFNRSTAQQPWFQNAKEEQQIK